MYIYIYYNTFLGTYEYYNPRLEQGAYTRLLASVHFLHEKGLHILCSQCTSLLYNDEIWYWIFQPKI